MLDVNDLPRHDTRCDESHATADARQVVAPRIDVRPIERRSIATWAWRGLVFGLAFPVVGILVASRGTFDVVAAHRSQPVLFIVDMAPLVLGVVGAVLGKAFGGLLGTRERIELEVALQTIELSATIDELTVMHAQLTQAQRLESIGSLAAGVAHEINTPIQFVGDNISFLRDSFDELASVHRSASELADAIRLAGVATSELAAFDATVASVDLAYLEAEMPAACDQAMEGIQRVTEIVRAMKSFSHPGSQDKAPMDVNEAVMSTLAVSRGEWKYVAEVTTDLDPQLPFVNAWAGPIKQAMLIIVINAAQAMAEHQSNGGPLGTIAVATTSSGDEVRITIADTGGGIPEEVQHRVFDHFFTTKEVGTGSGQGLALARAAVVEQHGGRLTFDVEPGVGTTFTMALPIS